MAVPAVLSRAGSEWLSRRQHGRAGQSLRRHAAHREELRAMRPTRRKLRSLLLGPMPSRPLTLSLAFSMVIAAGARGPALADDAAPPDRRKVLRPIPLLSSWPIGAVVADANGPAPLPPSCPELPAFNGPGVLCETF